MDYEKEYKEALERAKKLQETCDSQAVVSWCEYIFPQLKESEDEMIRKELIEHVKDQQSSFISAPDCRDKYEEEENNKYNSWIAWLEKAYITNQYNEHKEEVITRLYQDLKREFFNGSSYENMFPTYTSTEDDVRRRSTIQVLEYARSLDVYNQFGKADIDKNIAWLEKQGSEPNWCHHKVDLSNCSEEYRKAYYDGWNNCNQQHSQCKSDGNDVVKCLINGMKFYYEDNEEATWGTEKFSMKVKDILSWLEKQGEQKPVDKVEPKFNVGDWVIDNKNRVGIIVRILDEHYIVSFDGREVQISFEWEGKLFRKWSIKDAKDGDVLAEDTCTFIIKKLNHDLTAEIYCCLYSDGDFEINSNLWFDDTCTYPATKEQRDLLFQKMKEFGYEWDFEKKELMKIEKNTDVNHEYFSELLENDDSKDINDYAYQVAYCMSHDWLEETATWEDVQKAVKLGAEWQKQKLTWSDEDAYNSKLISSTINRDQDLSLKTKDKLTSWIKSIKQRIGI